MLQIQDTNCDGTLVIHNTASANTLLVENLCGPCARSFWHRTDIDGDRKHCVNEGTFCRSKDLRYNGVRVRGQPGWHAPLLMIGARHFEMRNVPITFVSHRRLNSASVRSSVVTCNLAAKPLDTDPSRRAYDRKDSVDSSIPCHAAAPL